MKKRFFVFFITFFISLFVLGSSSFAFADVATKNVEIDEQNQIEARGGGDAELTLYLPDGTAVDIYVQANNWWAPYPDRAIIKISSTSKSIYVRFTVVFYWTIHNGSSISYSMPTNQTAGDVVLLENYDGTKYSRNWEIKSNGIGGSPDTIWACEYITFQASVRLTPTGQPVETTLLTLHF